MITKIEMVLQTKH